MKTYTFDVTASVNFGFDVQADSLEEAVGKMRALINAPTDNVVEEHANYAVDIGGYELTTKDAVDVYDPAHQTETPILAEVLTNMGRS